MRGRWGLVALTQVAKIAYANARTGCRRTSGERRSTEVSDNDATALTTTLAAGLGPVTSRRFCSASVLLPLARLRGLAGGRA